jgi:hypothetical protein
MLSQTGGRLDADFKVSHLAIVTSCMDGYFLELIGQSRKNPEHQCRGLNRKDILDLLFTSP